MMRGGGRESTLPLGARTGGGREAILDAAGELLVTRGLVEVSIEAVAERAYVSREAILRWWPTEEALAVDVLYREWAALAGDIRRGACDYGI
ncbi:MAG TPA: TetR family transcriptional regulator [Solirubrobacteraceae bacterium]|jgi:AcrR family transcriptional regulator|nr:TetR family transcriptional regulator [Solirubrobacteraceae bacterium]